MDTFVTIVREYFDDIAKSHEMRCIEQHEFHVRYGNAKVTFGISWDRNRGYELGVGMGLESAVGEDRLSLNLWDILRFQDAAETSWVGGLSVNPQQDLREPVSELARLTRTYAHRLLNGDADAFESIAEFTGRRRITHDWRLEAVGADVEALFQQADAAWLKQDYKSVVKAYEAISFPLSPFAQERLAIAKQRATRGSVEE
jgi:hypothetical protein